PAGEAASPKKEEWVAAAAADPFGAGLRPGAPKSAIEIDGPAPAPGVVVYDEAPASEAPPRDEALEGIRAALEAKPRVLSRKQLGEETGLSAARVDRALARLDEEKLIRRYESGRAHLFSWHAHK